MSITIDLPPAMTQEALGYATLQGTSLEKMFIDLLAAELKRKQQAQSRIAWLDELAKATGKRLSGEPYGFNRADAYEREDAFA